MAYGRKRKVGHGYNPAETGITFGRRLASAPSGDDAGNGGRQASREFSLAPSEQREARRNARMEARAAMDAEAASEYRRAAGPIPPAARPFRHDTRPRRSDSIPVKWYMEKGPAIAGLRMPRGIFYAGGNQQALVSPRIAEPSVIDITCEVELPEDGARVPALPPFPCYAYMSSLQRGRYLKFLASSRSAASTPDIGYPTLYLYGIERRLIVDANRPGVVSDAERDALTKELLRLVAEFGPRSRAFRRAATALLLFDGRMFEGPAPDTGLISSTFFGKGMAADRLDVRQSDGYGDGRDAADAYEYMLLARLAQAGIRFPEQDLLNYAVMRLSRNQYGTQVLDGIAESDLLGKVMALARYRYRHASLDDGNGFPKAGDTGDKGRVASLRIPTYVPSSVSIRRHPRETDLSRRVFPIETLDVPFKELSDIVASSFSDLREYERELASKARRNLTQMAPDAVAMLTPPNGLARLLVDRQIAEIPWDALSAECERLFGDALACVSRDVTSTASRDRVRTLLASMGWQAMLPDAIAGDQPAAHWKWKRGMPLVCSRRGASFARLTGRQALAPLMGSGDTDGLVVIDSDTSSGFAAACVYAWFLSQVGAALDGDAIRAFPMQSAFPGELTGNIAFVRFVCAYVMAAMSYGVLPSDLNDAIARAAFSDVQSAVFSWCSAKHGIMLPEGVMETIERLYEKAGHDKAMVLYDYRAGDYRVNRDGNGEDGGQEGNGFSLDDGLVAATRRATAATQGMLTSAMAGGADITEDVVEVPEESADDDGDIRDGKQLENPMNDDDILGPMSSAPAAVEGTGADMDDGDGGDDSAHAAVAGDAAADSAEGIITAIREAFGNGDEMPTDKLKRALRERFGLTTDAEAMGLIARANDTVMESSGEEFVEIDGEDAYLN